MSNRYAIILAAGQGTRMKSKLYKVLHPVCGKPMVQHVVDQVNRVGFDEKIAIVGHGAEVVQEVLGDQVSYVVQEKQLGTGHAVLQAEQLLADKKGTTVVLCGDTPLLTEETIDQLLQAHEKESAKVTVLTAIAADPTGYGRVIRNQQGLVERIVEQKDASEEEKQVNEINTGTYCFDNETLFAALQKVGNDNAQGEYYLPDVVEIVQSSSGKVAAFQANTMEETMGINDRVALSAAEAIMKKRTNEKWMRSGVTIIDPSQTYISTDATIGPDTVIYPGTMINGQTIIGADCLIGPNSELTNSQIGNNTIVKQSVVSDSEIGDDVQIGPFAHIRPQSILKDEVKIGNFVEVKKATIGKGSKASHLSYIGDAEIGQDVNFGCGAITVNYDGKSKYLTSVGDRAFIGCNANLIAPVTIGADTLVAAGSTITDDVPSRALSIARARQTNKENYQK
ncbi:N-acetylglucosamine-1-phosphate uridyltransferase [Alkalihalobacillus alcalophilus ATCC 27647 = CGMCC 1.3604]|uniref:Bifunctional protein GlmU n=1 Tax=Alkalihalobacillus alcalophilus ATCC 27647 = CGMCC 1.3604 TaxID=1218173 RepID=A0A094XB85_ALKAL|nr:bifunctional UDP-N-acetylglucosamine diphosphorylase/glucosamine-1-phosphate N-acetyltransferase GlmU [Alkalihalobacillus alcalophilus]KGA96065.1 bifunctional N-acetylglucosamine-1-phosphate uridyltransferase/glucosamine-1-phosphate acetyltransferase [Alkalihalobacillus alcalophilus ATCC 27647 = CGMCC 1.3604]MED1562399.1 bifunctional UDP-N-acetylglucosamine diphosphorylase/glucosamine-1-phosphate N-acetyltransferase GlmU [Alkalihalobacillus alcalophilus]THG90065.1 N-acetylglucosamine-1-phosph